MNKRIQKKQDRQRKQDVQVDHQTVIEQILEGFGDYAPWVDHYQAAKATKDFVRKGKYLRNDGNDWVFAYGGFQVYAQHVARDYGLATPKEIEDQESKLRKKENSFF